MKTENLNVVIFVSRNKDNNNVENFKQRKESFLTNKTLDDETIVRRFNNFVNDGVDGEMSRLYVSVNARDKVKSQKALMHHLLDNEVKLETIEGLAVRFAMKATAAEKKKLFDFDVDNQEAVIEFVDDLVSRGLTYEEVHVNKTPNGYAVVADRGVDMRGLVDMQPDNHHKKDKGPWKWTKGEVTYKHDGFLYVSCSRKGE